MLTSGFDQVGRGVTSNEGVATVSFLRPRVDAKMGLRRLAREESNEGQGWEQVSSEHGDVQKRRFARITA